MPLLCFVEKVGVVPASRRKIKRTWNAFGGGTYVCYMVEVERLKLKQMRETVES